MSNLNKLITIMETSVKAQIEINKLFANRIAQLEAELDATRSTQGETN